MRTSVEDQKLTCFRQQLERVADPLTQATPFKPLLPPLDYRKVAWAPMVMALDVTVTFSWMAFLGYGLVALIFWVFRILG